jgi:hypothetical protein
MPSETIALFSSDARDLYKADVYRALALPKGYVLHFRYPQKYIQPEILMNLESVVNQHGVIFYVSGNDTSIAPDQRQLTLYSIRSVVIKDIVPDPNIGSVHFYLEMRNFADVTPHAGTNRSILPPTLFVSKISVEEGPNNEWINRVDAVRAHFTSLPFFLLESVRQGARHLSPAYSEPDKASSYHLHDESDYQVNIVTYDPTMGTTGLTVENGSTDITLAIPVGHRIGAQSDAQPYKLQTHSLPRQKVASYSRFLGVNYATTAPPAPGGPDYRVMLEWTVQKKWTKVWQFGGLSILASLGLGLAKLATDDLATFKVSYINGLFALGAAACIGLAAALFYVVFNKK